MEYSLQDIAAGGAAAIAVSTALTQEAKRLIELKWKPTDPAHDSVVEGAGLAIAVVVVVVAALLTTPAPLFSAPWWHVALTAVVVGVGIKYGSSGLYKRLTNGKVDGAGANVVGQLVVLSALVPKLSDLLTVLSMNAPPASAPSVVLPVPVVQHAPPTTTGPTNAP